MVSQPYNKACTARLSLIDEDCERQDFGEALVSANHTRKVSRDCVIVNVHAPDVPFKHASAQKKVKHKSSLKDQGCGH